MAKEKALIVKGLALWCKPSTPDYKFKKETGEYSTKLIITEETRAKIEPVLQGKLDAFYEELVSKAKNPTAARKQVKKVPIFKEEINDETGESTGNYVLTFKRPAKFIKKETGEEWPQKVPVYVSKGQLAPKGFQIGNGSEIAVAFTLNHSKGMDAPGYFVPASKEVGLSFRLEAISVLKLVEYSGASNPFGEDDFAEEGAFDMEDDGFGHVGEEKEEEQNQSNDGGDLF